LQLSGRLFFDIRFEDDAIGRASLFLLDFQVFLEKAQRLDPVGGSFDLKAVKGIAFVQPEFAADDLVLGQRITIDVDPFDIHAITFRDLEENIHGQRVFVPRKLRANIGKGIAEQSGGFRQALNRVLHLFGIVEIAGLHRQLRRKEFWREIPDLAFHGHIAKLVPITLFDNISDDEIALVRREFGHGGDDTEIGIAFCQIELTELLLVKGEAIRIVSVAGAEETIEARLLGNHFTAQLTVREFFITDDVDLLDL